MINLMISLVLSLGVMGVGGCPTVTAWRGEFIIDGDHTGCNAKLNDIEIPITDLVRTRGYGLLQMDCPSCSYQVVSTFGACDDCIICTHNEGILKCKSVALPIILAVSMTLVLTLFLIWVLHRVDNHLGFIQRIHALCLSRRHKRRAARADKIRPIVKLELLKHLRENENSSQDQASESNEKENTQGSRSKSPSPSQILTAILLSASTAKACDNTLMMSAEGSILANDSIIVSHTGLLTIHSSSTLCFQYEDGTSESLRMNSIVKNTHYNSVYHACSYNMTSSSRYRCAWTSECWDDSNCNSNYIDPKLAHGEESPDVTHYGCEMVPNSSPSHCTHEQICVWYKWKVVPNENECDLIYSLGRSNLEVEFIHTSRKGDVLTFKLSPSGPNVLNPINVHLVNIMDDPTNIFSHLRRYKGRFYGTKACDLNSPLPSLLGDMQTAIDHDEFAFPEWAVQCSVDGHRATCSTPESGYKRSLKTDLRNLVEVVQTDGLSVVVATSLKGSASLMFRVKDKPAQVIKTASCSFKVEYVYGCTSCEEDPFVVISAMDIDVSGLMRFSSNCSFFLQEVECAHRSQKIQLIGRPTQCLLNFPGTNSSLTILVPYEFRGDIYRMGVITYKSEVFL